MFDEALAVVARAGLEPEVRHLANSPATLTRPRAHYDLVRTGLAVYGLSPAPAGGERGRLRPAPRADASAPGWRRVKRVPQGAGVSYGHTFVTDRPTTLGLVPLGYGDGMPRSASNRAEVLVGGAGRGWSAASAWTSSSSTSATPATAAGDEVVLIGPGDAGEPTAQDWAEWTGTIAYEVVTRLGGRIIRRYTGEHA